MQPSSPLIRLRRLVVILACAAAWTIPASAHQQHAHTHGRLSLDVAMDAQSITVLMESPLDSFLGFERAPRNDMERKRVAQLVAQWNAADQLLQPAPAAGCQLAKVELVSDVLGLGSGHGHSHSHGHGHANDPAVHQHHSDADGHGDISIEVVFTCAKAEAASHLDIKLFDVYKRLKHIDAQVASPQGQFKLSLNPGAARLNLVR